MDLILFGIQGSGKGTQAKKIAEKYHMEIFETGAELRKLSQEESELGLKVKSIIESGHLVPNDVVMEIVENFLNHLESSNGVIFDGIPRQIHQAETLNSLLKHHNRDYKALYIELSEESAFKRLLGRQRNDDTPEVIERRISIFKTETIPAIDLYREEMIKVDGEPSIEEVTEVIFKELDKLNS